MYSRSVLPILLLITLFTSAARAEQLTPAETPARLIAASDDVPRPAVTEALGSVEEESKSTARTRVISGLKGDVLGGGWIAAMVLNGTANAIVRGMRGEKPDDAAEHALRDLTKTEFLVGNLLAGSAGAALGASLPVPMLRGAPMFVRTAASAAAPLAFTAVASTLATNGIALHRRGKLTGSNLVKSVDWWNLFGQTAGSLVGMSLGATLVSAGLAPALAIGSVAMVPVLGGIVGAVGGALLVNWIRTKARARADKAVESSTGAGTTGPEVPKKNGTPAVNADAGVPAAPAGVAPEVLIADPYADLPVIDTVRLR